MMNHFSIYFYIKYQIEAKTDLFFDSLLCSCILYILEWMQWSIHEKYVSTKLLQNVQNIYNLNDRIILEKK